MIFSWRIWPPFGDCVLLLLLFFFLVYLSVHSSALLRGVRWERPLLYILQASQKTIPQDVLLFGACTDAALTSALQEHTRTHTHCVHPLFLIPPTPTRPLLASFPRCFSSLAGWFTPCISWIFFFFFLDKTVVHDEFYLKYFNKDLTDQLRKSRWNVAFRRH